MSDTNNHQRKNQSNDSSHYSTLGAFRRNLQGPRERAETMVESGGPFPSERLHAGIQVVRVTDCGKRRSSRCEGRKCGKIMSKHFLGVSSRQENLVEEVSHTPNGNIGESIALNSAKLRFTGVGSKREKRGVRSDKIIFSSLLHSLHCSGSLRSCS